MKKYFLYILILISCAISNVALSAQTPNSNIKESNTQCGVTDSGLVPPWSFCFSNEDVSARMWAATNPSMFENITFNYIENVKDLIPKEKSSTDKEQIIENAKESEKTLSDINYAFYHYIFIIGLFISIIVICIVSIAKYMDGDIDKKGKDGAVYTIHTIILTAILLAGLMPWYKNDNSSLIQNFYNYCKIYGAAAANGFNRHVLSFTQSNTIITSEVDIEKRLQNLSRNKNTNIYAYSQSYVNKMFLIELCLLRSENITNDKINTLPEKIAFNTYTKINGSDFTVSTNFSARTDRNNGVAYDCGQTQNNIADIKSISGAYATIARNVNYDDFLKRVAQTTTLENSSSVYEIWNDLEGKLISELKAENTANLTTEQKDTMSFFSQNLFSYGIHSILTNNKINGVDYNQSFLAIEEQIRAIAANVNAANCLANDATAMENISKALNYESKFCGYIDKSGKYQEIITNDSVSYDVLIAKASNTITELTLKVQKARMNIEAQFAKSIIRYSNTEDFASLSKAGYSKFPLTLNMVMQDGIFSQANEIRNNISIYPKSSDSDNFFGIGNIEFQALTKGFEGSGDLKKAITDAFKDSMPTLENTKQALITSYAIDSKVESNPFKNIVEVLGIEPFTTKVKRNFGIPETASFTKKAYESCFPAGLSSEECPLRQVNFMAGMTKSLTEINRTATDIIAVGFGLKFVGSGMSIYNDVAKGKGDKSDNNSGKISSKDNTNRNDASKNSAKNNSQFIDKTANAASNLGDIFIAFGFTALIFFSGILDYITLTPYYYFVSQDIMYQFLTTFVIIAVPLFSIALLISSGVESVFKFILKTAIRIVVFPVLLMIFTAIAYFCLSMFISYLFAIILVLDIIRENGNQNLIAEAILNWLFVVVAVIFGGSHFVKFIFGNVFIYFYEALHIVATKVEEFTDSALIQIQTLSAAALNTLMIAVENRGTFSQQAWFNDMKKDVNNHRAKSIQRAEAKELRKAKKLEEKQTAKESKDKYKDSNSE